MIVHISPFNLTTGLINESDKLTNVISCEITRDATDETSLLESATVKLDSTSFSAGWYAVDALTDGKRNRLGVFYFTITGIEEESDASMVLTLTGTSVLKPAYSERVTAGWSVVKGNSGTDAVKMLLEACPTELNIEPFSIQKTQSFSSNVTKLGACWSILRNANMCIQIGDSGDINVVPIPTSTRTKTISLKSGELTGSVSVDDNEVGYSCQLKGRPYDNVYVNLPTFGIQNYLKIASQSIDLSQGLTAEETLKETVYDDNKQ